MSIIIRPLYPVVGPFIKSQSGHSFIGVVEYDETEDKVKCHECGEYFSYLGPHVLRHHRMTLSGYRIKHGLNFNQPLCGKALSSQRRGQLSLAAMKRGHRALRKRRKTIKRQARPRHNGNLTEAQKNKHGLCEIQMRTRYEVIKKAVGHTPTTGEIKKHDHALLSAIERRHKTLNAYRKIVGDKSMTAQEHHMKSEGELLSHLIHWCKSHPGIIPTVRDFEKSQNGYPQYSTYLGRFGSWKHALSLAGIV